MTLFQSIVLGVVQGLTEFLPVSSSGHLVLAKALFGISGGNDISFEVFVHFGTFLSVVAVFRNDIARMLASAAGAVRDPAGIVRRAKEDESFRYVLYVIVGCIPAGIAGILFDETIEALFSDPKLVSEMLLVTGLILFLTRFARQTGDGAIGLRSSLGVGLAQAVAILPGVSRSGSTIGAALMMGVSRDAAARYSFLMALPVIFGATLLKLRHLIAAPPSPSEIAALAAGTVAASLTGYVAIKLLFAVLRRGSLQLFAYYCFAAGVLGLLFVQ